MQETKSKTIDFRRFPRRDCGVTKEKMERCVGKVHERQNLLPQCGFVVYKENTLVKSWFLFSWVMFKLPQRSGSIKGRIKAKTIFSNVVFISNFESILIKASFGPDENFFDIFYASIYSTWLKKFPYLHHAGMVLKKTLGLIFEKYLKLYNIYQVIKNGQASAARVIFLLERLWDYHSHSLNFHSLPALRHFLWKLETNRQKHCN